ncbi:MAG: hypothetical protein P9M13_03705 [Candidatus Ancaeobacter aquaticus]|nr:hypothetical protein [Candidatus Ancaeobacter aquaticus]
MVRKQNPKQNAFALMELLVVIGIIIILIGILLPALNFARQAALKAQCASRLKNLAYAIQAYATDYDGYYPYIDNANPEGAVNGFSAKLGNYVKTDSTDVFKCTHTKTDNPGDMYYFYYPDFNTYYPTNPRNLYYKNVGGKTARGDTGTGSVPVFMCRSSDGFYPHNHGVNVLYADGHVIWEKK